LRILKHTSKRLLGSTFLRRSLSVLVLAFADGVALVIGLSGAAWLSGGDRVLNLAPLLLAAWIPLFAAFRLYDRAPVRRNPGALVGSVFCWAGLVAIVAATLPRDRARSRGDSARRAPGSVVRRRAPIPLRAHHWQDLPPRLRPDAGAGGGETKETGQRAPDDGRRNGRLHPGGRGEPGR
jgi:hypothetical protein